MEFFTYRLPNGIRGIHRQVKSNVAHCALVVNAGSRDEHPDQYGLAHFTEHAFFKGTRRRRAWQVNCRLENLGGELNAFTTKEDTTIHATTLRGDFPKAVELIADIAFRSTFPDRELEREKEVIADEINTYKDSPADLIYDTFEEMLFAGSELGHNILGRKAVAHALRRRRDPRLHRHARTRPTRWSSLRSATSRPRRPRPSRRAISPQQAATHARIRPGRDRTLPAAVREDRGRSIPTRHTASSAAARTASAKRSTPAAGPRDQHSRAGRAPIRC